MSAKLKAEFIVAGRAYKALAKVIRYEDGDRAWQRLDELKRQWLDAAWRLHEEFEGRPPAGSGLTDILPHT